MYIVYYIPPSAAALFCCIVVVFFLCRAPAANFSAQLRETYIRYREQVVYCVGKRESVLEKKEETDDALDNCC